MEIIDLTKPLDENLSIYAEAGYSDPPFEVEAWCTVQEQGYQVARLALGTQTGTHLDAPMHFLAGGAGLEALPVEALLGKYLWLNLDAGEQPFEYHGEPILFLAARGNLEISASFFETLLALPCRVWVIVYEVSVVGREVFHFNRRLAELGKFLIENIDESAAARVRPGGELVALPLRLVGVSGSPCRVLVRQNLNEKRAE